MIFCERCSGENDVFLLALPDGKSPMRNISWFLSTLYPLQVQQIPFAKHPTSDDAKLKRFRKCKYSKRPR